jgi:hypothetical protein
MDPVEPVDIMVGSALSVPSPEIDSVTLQRLIEEVRTGEPVVTGSYNRTHNRHNR